MNTYRTKDRRLYDNKNIVRLSKREGQLLALLSDNEMHNIEEINKFIYGKIQQEISVIRKGYMFGKTTYERNKYIDNQVIITLVYRLRKKLKDFNDIKIKKRNEIGYMMKGDVFIT